MSRRVVLFSGTREAGAMYMPLCIMALGSTLHEAGFEPLLIDPTVEPRWAERLEEALPDTLFLGLSCLTGPGIDNVLLAIDIARRVNPGMPLVWGGYHSTLAHGSIVRQRHVDICTVGPGDEIIVELARAIERHDGRVPPPDVLAGISNLVFLRDGEVVSTRRTFIKDMNALPAMNYSLIDVPAYFTDEKRQISYISSYGCPYECTFCSEPTQSERLWKALAPVRVVDEITALQRQYDPDLISFMDPNFSTDARRVAAILEEMKRRGAYVPVYTEMRARDVVRLATKIDLAALREVGFLKIWVGIESGSERMLARLKKGSTVEDAVRACNLLADAGIECYTSFIHDLPGETDEDMMQTIALSERLAAIESNRQFHHFFIPFPATALYTELVGTAVDDGRPQTEWAKSNTYGGTPIWPGRRDFRERVLTRLSAVKERFPATFEHMPLPAP